MPKRPAEERFWPKVNKTDTCWLWEGQILANGYGRFWDGERQVVAHRFAYELVVGPIPTGLQIDHVAERGCTSKACVRPEHLEPVTQSVNLLRAFALKPKVSAEAKRANKTEWARRDREQNPERYRAADKRHYDKTMATEEGRRRLAEKARRTAARRVG